MMWHVAFERIRPCLVRIDTESGFGTGFLFSFNQDHSLTAIATAAHVVEDAHLWKKPLKIMHYDSGQVEFYSQEMRAIWLDQSHDAATILIGSNSLPLPGTTLPLIEFVTYMKVGVEVAWAGFPVTIPQKPCFFSGKVSCFLETEACYLLDGVAINGVSGGPVFAVDEANVLQIIGIVSAYVPNQQVSGPLPGLLRAQDVTSFHKHIKEIKNLAEARKQGQAYTS